MTLPPPSPPPPGPAPRWRLGLLALLLAPFAAVACDQVAWRGARARAAPVPADRPIEVLHEGFVSSDACRACHPAAYASWHGSYHRSMTREASPENVKADFADVELEIAGARYRLWREGDTYFAELPDPEAPRGKGVEPPRLTVELALITGSHHFQAFWYPSGSTRSLSLLPICYRLDEGRWMPLDAAFIVPPRMHQDPGEGRWNQSCNKCHATVAQPRISGPGEMDTRATEFGIACEACHGPGEAHVRANSDPLRRYGEHFADGVDPTIVQPQVLEPRRSAEVCGQCHGITTAAGEAEMLARVQGDGFSYRPGDVLSASRTIGETGDQYFWPDGIVRVSGREYNGLLRTPCFEDGSEERGTMTCLSCHRMHQPEDDPRPLAEWADDQLAPGMDGDLACTQCHGEYVAADALQRHTRHAPESSGSRCMNCHMPYTTWGLMKAMRSHTVTSPSAQESLEAGRPNACNLCHLDRPLGWTADRLAEGWEVERPELAELDEEVAASILWALRGDAGLRAILAWSFGWEPAKQASGTDWIPPYLAQLLLDPYHVVRFRAFRSLQALPGYGELDYDFVGPARDREAAARRALEVWGAEPLPGPREHLLIGPAGGLRERLFRALLAERDDRPVTLEE